MYGEVAQFGDDTIAARVVIGLAQFGIDACGVTIPRVSP